MNELELIDKWIDWNEKETSPDDFCMCFESFFRDEIRKRITQRNLRKKILKELLV